MGFSSILIVFAFVTLPYQISESATVVVVTGSLDWKNPQVQVGDSVIFQNKYEYKLYVFQNQKAFGLCNFTQATFLKQPNSTSYTWHTSRAGFFYFSYYNGSNKLCQQGQKLAVKVSLPPTQNHATSPELPPQVAAPQPSSGGVVASSPAFPWPFQPREATSPGPAPDSSMTAISPMGPEEGIPFINSNPVVPLPTGEVDSATIRPWSTSGDLRPKQVVGFSTLQRASSYIVLMLLIGLRN
ncbi:uncharacterized protein [Primulina huaijiensis]|uniref:uncharacterized protein n=1 Tax=Primulina huaijiensis TaxID=1492673 RepID=UPI003CC74E57